MRTRADWTSYGWDELADIAHELALCADDEAALACAQRYGLCGTDGSLDAGATKEVMLADGTRAQAVLLGWCHDERCDGGLAGLSFALVGTGHVQPMNHRFEDSQGERADSRGGWAASEMRAWLDGTFWYELPASLRTQVARVQKRTASQADATAELAEAGHLSGSAADWVGQTADRLWLLSAAELCDVVPARDDLDVDATMSQVYGAEGPAYRLFAQEGVEAFAANDLLAGMGTAGGAPATWWLRTKTLEFGDGFWLVGTDGCVLNGLGEDARVVNDPEFAPQELWGPDHARVLVVGFCL